MKIILDTNTIFSALLKTQSIFGEVIFNSQGIFEFYAPHYLKTEIRRHWDKIKRISRLTDQQLKDSYESLLTRVTFINEEIIPQKTWENSEKLTEGIDPDDTDFIALTKHLKGKLWTGDLKLCNGLKKKGFKNVLTTNELIKLWHKKRKQLR